MIQCRLCCYESEDKDDFFAVLNRGSTSYECGWDFEKDCRRRQDAFRKKERERIQKLKEESVSKGTCNVSKSDLRQMSQEDQFECKYALSFSDLEKDDLQYRDACTRYTHKETGDHFKWSFVGGEWNVC